MSSLNQAYSYTLVGSFSKQVELQSSSFPFLQSSMFFADLSLFDQSVKYSRGTFIFPGAQPPPHRNFSEEVALLNNFFGSLKSGGNDYVIINPSMPNHKWHIYYATETLELPIVTLEMCMTGLNVERTSIFFKNSSDGHPASAKAMTKLSGISDIIPEMEICDFAFEPCGYSMNGIHDSAFSTIHVTPEEGFSYASSEVMGFNPQSLAYQQLVQRVLQCFRPAEFSLAANVLGGRPEAAASWPKRVDILGYNSSVSMELELAGGGLLIYQTFATASMNASLLKSELHHCEDRDC